MGKNLQTKIYIAGHRGMAGSAIMRTLNIFGFNNLITRTHSELDLTNQQQVQDFFVQEKPDQVYLAAAKVGGIQANSAYPAEFIYQNIIINSNVINSAFISGVKKFLFLGSSCVYPRLAIQPIPEDALLTSSLEPTNEPYAVAKISGIKLCESYNRQYGESHSIDYRSVIPANVYGPGDNYDLDNGHVVPGLIRRFHEAKLNNMPSIKVWGSGNPKREFLHADDMASACVYIMNIDKNTYKKYIDPMCSHINVGHGLDITIKELAELIKKITGFAGSIEFDSSKPDGAPRKILNISKIKSLGWSPKFTLNEGLIATYDDYKKQSYYQE